MMELTISILAVIVSIATFLFTIMVTYRGEQREKKQATLDALNVLQEQVFDKLNMYTFGEIRDVAEKWSASIEAKNKYVENKEGTAGEFWESHQEYDSVVHEYRKISGYLARIEHFSLGVNTGIYDAKVTERAATRYFVMLFKKMMPILSVKNGGSARDTELNNTFHNEFSTLVERIGTIEKDK
jgi:hypothetical protein